MTEPAWLVRARAELGVRETPGPKSTARILQYRDMAGVKLGGEDGATPWCAIFANAMLEASGIHGTRSGMGRSFMHWGVGVAEPFAGAVCAFSSDRGPTSGHATFATGRYTSTHIEVLGGNQGDAVSIALWPRSKLLGYRWPAAFPLPVGRPVAIAGAAAKPVSDR